MHQRHDIATLGAKIGRAQYKKVQHSRKDEKDKKSEEDGEDKRSEEGYWENKINLVIKKNSIFEANVYHHIIYKY